MKDFYVIFTEDGARVIKGEEPTSPHLKNPSLLAVRGIPPHRWAEKNGQIVIKIEPEPKKEQIQQPIPVIQEILPVMLPVYVEDTPSKLKIATIYGILSMGACLLYWYFLS